MPSELERLARIIHEDGNVQFRRDRGAHWQRRREPPGLVGQHLGRRHVGPPRPIRVERRPPHLSAIGTARQLLRDEGRRTASDVLGVGESAPGNFELKTGFETRDSQPGKVLVFVHEVGTFPPACGSVHALSSPFAVRPVIERSTMSRPAMHAGRRISARQRDAGQVF
jgi:hypothetical protein